MFYKCEIAGNYSLFLQLSFSIDAQSFIVSGLIMKPNSYRLSMLFIAPSDNYVPNFQILLP